MLFIAKKAVPLQREIRPQILYVLGTKKRK